MTEPLDETLCLSPTEARIVGCLIEKAATTPESYPLTVNSLVLAANQKTSREPIMSIEEGEVGHALRELEDRGWVRVVHGSRAHRYEHRIEDKLSVTRPQHALLSAIRGRPPLPIGPHPLQQHPHIGIASPNPAHCAECGDSICSTSTTKPVWGTMAGLRATG